VDDIVGAAGELVRALEATSIVYALGGALANGVWGVPRATLDIDLNVWCTQDEIDDTFANLASIGVEGDVGTAVARARGEGVAYMRWRGVRLDIFVPSIPYYAEALRTRVRLDLPDIGSAWVLSAEAICVFKLLFFRPKDLIDLEKLVRVRGAALDAAYVRARIVEMLGADDERVQRWDAILGRTSPASD
jgi:hypothetical protein